MQFLRSKYTPFIVLGAVFVVVGVIGYIHLQKDKTVSGVPTLIEDSPEESEDGNYYIYRNETYGYSFEYPKTWNIEAEDDESIYVVAGEIGSKYILVDLPYPADVLGEMSFSEWAELQTWPFSPTSPSEYFEEVKVPTGLSTYKRAGTTTVHTVIAPVHKNVFYISRTDGTGEGTYKGEDVYFHLLNTFSAI